MNWPLNAAVLVKTLVFVILPTGVSKLLNCYLVCQLEGVVHSLISTVLKFTCNTINFIPTVSLCSLGYKASKNIKEIFISFSL